MPVAINIIVAIMELTDNLPIPHIPCPDVQPPLSLVPSPTKNPPIIINIYEWVILKVIGSLVRLNSNGPNTSPNRKKILDNPLV